MGQCQDTALAAGPGVISPALNCTAKQAVLAGILVPHGKTSDQRTRGGCGKRTQTMARSKCLYPQQCPGAEGRHRDRAGQCRDGGWTAEGWPGPAEAGLALAGHPGLPFMPTTATLGDHLSFHREKSTEGKKRFATSHKKMVQGKAEKLVKL